MNADHEHLRQELQAATLTEVRKVRRHRRLVRLSCILALPLILLHMLTPDRELQQASIPDERQDINLPESPRNIPGTSIAIVDDEGLLKLLDGHAFAILGKPGEQSLVLLD